MRSISSRLPNTSGVEDETRVPKLPILQRLRPRRPHLHASFPQRRPHPPNLRRRFRHRRTGTGLVHIAPGHGQTTTNSASSTACPILAPVDDAAASPPNSAHAGDCKPRRPIRLQGQRADHRTPQASELLFAQEEYPHDYPHCWRSKTPIVFRAVKQWFIKVDAFRADALAAIEKREVDSRIGQKPHPGRGRKPARLVHLAPAHLGHSPARLLRRGRTAAPERESRAQVRRPRRERGRGHLVRAHRRRTRRPRSTCRSA